MTYRRLAALILTTLASTTWIRVFGQSVVSTHSGIVYFFAGAAFLDGEPLVQQFGRFPDIGEGRELRTEMGRAEVLLTPGVFLRLDANSSIRMLSTSFSDTRVELLTGSAILDVTETTPTTAVKLIYRNWQIRVALKGVCRVDAQPPRVRSYEGEVDVAAMGNQAGVSLHDGEVLPLAAVLVPEPHAPSGNDDFEQWELIRSEAISADNTIAAGIVDDPADANNSGPASGAYTYFPSTAIAYSDIASPYGLGFWSPYQSAFNSLYFSSFIYVPVHLRSPGIRRPYPRSYGGGGPVVRRWSGTVVPRPAPARMLAPRAHVTPRVVAPHK